MRHENLVLAMLLALWIQAIPAAGFDPFGAATIDNHRIGTVLPRDLTFTDQHGRTVSLGQVLDRRPALLVPLYYRCPNVCGAALATLFNQLDSQPYRLGRDFQLLAVSFDPREDIAAAREELSKLMQRRPALASEPSLHLLTADAANSQALMQALGFGYRYDSQLQQYAHSAAIAVITGQGKLSRWLYGLGYQPSDLRLALTEAGEGKLGKLGEQLLLLCYHYDPQSGTYNTYIFVLLQVAGVATVLVLALFIARALRRDRRPPKEVRR